MDKINIKEWADKKDAENRQTINEYIANGISKKEAYHMVMDASTLGAGYKAQLHHDLGLGLFD